MTEPKNELLPDETGPETEEPDNAEINFDSIPSDLPDPGDDADSQEPDFPDD